jgi:hypothetical protein
LNRYVGKSKTAVTKPRMKQDKFIIFKTGWIESDWIVLFIINKFMVYIKRKRFNPEYCCSQVQALGTPVHHRQLHSDDERWLGSFLQATWHHGCDPQVSHEQEDVEGQSSHRDATLRMTSSQLELKIN